ncbi:transposase [Micromonospora sp. NPDC048830]|uniref:transposase n=1 Tax=Micromonospora sp. NPDC048830 TaxID=3364257 RepID=UPI003714EFEA
MPVIVRRERPHPGAQPTLFEERDGCRYTAFVTNTQVGALQWLKARHHGPRPSRECAINQAWYAPAAIAVDLIAWLQIGGLGGDLAKAEPKSLRYHILHTAARLVRGQRGRWLRIPVTWPWVEQITAAFNRIAAIPPPAG